MHAKFYWVALLLLAMSGVPACAQFEISPDHFDDNPSSSQQGGHSNWVATLKLQIAEQKKLLASYQDRLLKKSALVTKAREALENSPSATVRDDLLRQKSELRELRLSLAGPIREAQLALARLERQQQALHPSARVLHARSSTTVALSASK
ncbi:MAG TPA: hypothetical protein VFT65_05420 [Candidatus Angelobacter sp.]|nr:hypothetical protein [Candidatus Angelobacter sp.]